MHNLQISHLRPGLNSKAIHSTYVEKAYALLTEIRPSDGGVKPANPLGAYRQEQAMCQHRVSPSSSSHMQHTYTTKTVIYTVTLTSLLSVQNTDTRPPM